jgi:hypothetical protein
MVLVSGDGILPDPHEVQRQVLYAMIELMCLDICASVPFYFNYQSCDRSRTSPRDTINCQSLIWPLYVAGSMGWVMHHLIRLGNIIGTKQTSMLAAILLSKE